jgi:hypothetical protein
MPANPSGSTLKRLPDDRTKRNRFCIVDLGHESRESV